MAERDCSKHNKSVTVKYTDATPSRHSNLIAALCRTIAEYTDGFCAVEHAYDADIIKSSGMKFWFVDGEKVKLFKDRLKWYLQKDDVYGRLTIN